MTVVSELSSLPVAAREAGVRYRTAHKWLSEGLLTAVRLPAGTGSQALLDEEDRRLMRVLGRLARLDCGLRVLWAARAAFDEAPKAAVVSFSYEGCAIQVEMD